MTKSEAQKLAEQCGFTWLDTMDYGDQLLEFANRVQEIASAIHVDYKYFDWHGKAEGKPKPKIILY